MSELRLRRTIRSSFTLISALLITLASVFSSGSFESGFLSVSDAAAVFAGAVTGGIQGASSAGLFLLAGCAGLPVFPFNHSGSAFLSSPYGGYVCSCFFSALVSGLICGKPSLREKPSMVSVWLRTAIAVLSSFAVYIAVSSIWEIAASDSDFYSVIIKNARLLPFFCAKASVCVPAAVFLRPPAAKLMYPEGEKALKEQEEIIQKIKEIKEKKANKKGGSR
ncbi:MAG: biotin transporter BioY [Treponema sp.]|nr:biotin transporter BioY [Treponema sp.]